MRKIYDELGLVVGSVYEWADWDLENEGISFRRNFCDDQFALMDASRIKRPTSRVKTSVVESPRTRTKAEKEIVNLDLESFAKDGEPR